MISELELIKMVLEYIVLLHETGIVAGDDTIDKEELEFKKALESGDDDLAEVKLADFKIAKLSCRISTLFDSFLVGPNFLGAIANGKRRLDWIKENDDMTKTAQELWDASSVILKGKES